MPKLQDTCAREAIYDILRQGPLTRQEVVRILAESDLPSYRPGTVGRVIGSLVNDGLVSVSRRGREECRYLAEKAPDDLIRVLRSPQTSRYVSWVRGERKTGYNSRKPPRCGETTRIGRYGPIHPSFEERPYTGSMMVDDGSEDRGIDWIDGPDNSMYIQADWLLRARVGYRPQA